LTNFSFTKAEEIIGKLREAEIVLAQSGTVADARRRISLTEQSYYRWRSEHGANARPSSAGPIGFAVHIGLRDFFKWRGKRRRLEDG
jgi:hypothetical protein